MPLKDVMRPIAQADTFAARKRAIHLAIADGVPLCNVERILDRLDAIREGRRGHGYCGWGRAALSGR